MKELTKEVGYTTDCMGNVFSITLEFSQTVLESIKKHRLYVANNSDVFKVVINFDGVELLDSSDEKADFRMDGGELFIFADSLYFYGQSKYEASVNFESKAIAMSELFDAEELEPKTYTLVNDARELLKKEGYFVQNLWSDGDIIGTGENMDIEITEEQALEIMELMGRRVDASIGVNWDFIEAIIEEYFNNQ